MLGLIGNFFRRVVLSVTRVVTKVVKAVITLVGGVSKVAAEVGEKVDSVITPFITKWGGNGLLSKMISGFSIVCKRVPKYISILNMHLARFLKKLDALWGAAQRI